MSIADTVADNLIDLESIEEIRQEHRDYMNKAEIEMRDKGMTDEQITQRMALRKNMVLISIAMENVDENDPCHEDLQSTLITLMYALGYGRADVLKELGAYSSAICGERFGSRNVYSKPMRVIKITKGDILWASALVAVIAFGAYIMFF